ncbi:unnamed protein product [Aspergillus oryzae]|uniref:Unnamed protein product n=1 Tax=Aspergillus oryzae TaxID=5062 RepID=A0AAN4YDF6_ASPOZ|nr:unnamed protein product [Aspergillus oryzae]GMF84476.1 unnamed protein product [Aspergillus oryzae]GMG23895.1 unnamed protein product [Aspergillus oryzae]
MKPGMSGPRPVPKRTAPEKHDMGTLRCSAWYISLMTPPTIVEKVATVNQQRQPELYCSRRGAKQGNSHPPTPRKNLATSMPAKDSVAPLPIKHTINHRY